MFVRIALAAALFSTLLACKSAEREAPPPPVAQPAAQEGLTVLFTADLWGQLEPCGCSADMRGGLDRAAAYVKERRAAGPTLLVDAGDAWFDALHYEPRNVPQADRRARAVARSLAAMGVDAKAFFERDRVLPVEGFPEGRELRGPKVMEAGGVRLGLVPVDATADGWEAALAGGVAAARDQGAQVVAALVHAPRPRVLALSGAAAQAGADFVVGSHIDAIAEGEEARMVEAEVPVFFTQARGQSLLEIRLVRRGEGPLQIAGNPAEREREIEALEERIRGYEQRIVALPKGADAAPFRAKVEELQARRRALAEATVEPPATGNYLAWKFVPVTEDRASDPAVKQILADYDRDVAEANLAWAKANPRPCPTAAPGEASFVGGAVCAGCHPAAQAFWQETRHAHAWQTLVSVNKQYDLSCIGCHVTGWEKPGGACDVARTEGRENVTCESCHGPGSLHAAAPAQAKLPAAVPESTCVGCHTPENSTAFDHATYRTKIVGPGHGAKTE